MPHSQPTGGPPLRRALLLMSVSSLLVPAAGVLSQPILARGLGLADRGELAAAMAPALLIVSVATLGLPDALTFYVAKFPALLHRAILIATSLSLAVGLVALAGFSILLPFLSGGSQQLASLILLAAIISVPALALGAVRGAASGLQRWGLVSLERAFVALARVAALLVLWLLGSLDLTLAVIVSAGAPVLGVLAYVPLLFTPKAIGPRPPRPARVLVSFGGRVWLGSVTEMLMARLGQLFMVPLSNASELALFTVAVTISDLPIIIVLAIQGTLFGTNSREKDASRLALVNRVTLIYVLLGSLILAPLSYFLIAPVFGEDFQGAVGPTLLLILSVAVGVPGIMTAIGLSAWGRPGLRSSILLLTLLVYAIAFCVLVPSFGAVGGCLASLLGNLLMTTVMSVATTRVVGISLKDVLYLRRSDFVLAISAPIQVLNLDRFWSRSR